MPSREAEPRGRGRPPLTEAAKFRELAPEWKAKVDHLTAEAVNAEIVEVTKLAKLNKLEMKESQKVKDAKEAYDTERAPYKEASKDLGLKIEYLLKALHDMGKM